MGKKNARSIITTRAITMPSIRVKALRSSVICIFIKSVYQESIAHAAPFMREMDPKTAEDERFSRLMREGHACEVTAIGF
jgi:hypothetical protein